LADPEKEDTMIASGVAVDSRCPLCGAQVLSVGRSGRVLSEDLHPVALFRAGGATQGYTLCDDCGLLANLPTELTLN
jgi:hypothetical protein